MSCRDWNDLLMADGRRALDDALRRCTEIEEPEPWYRALGAVTASELMARAPLGVEWLVPDLVPRRAVIILGALPKAGKSFLTLDLAAAVAEGGTFLGYRMPEPGVALVCNFEDGPDELSKRLRRRVGEKAGEQLRERLTLIETPPEPSELLAKLRPAVRRGRPDLVVVDPLVELLDGRDENSAAEMGELIRRLRRLAQDEGPAIVIVHHARKTGGEGGVAFRGSTAITGGVAGLIEYEGKPDNAKLLVDLRSEPDRRLRVRMDRQTLRWTLTDDGADLSDRILAALENGPMTYADLGAALGVSRGTLTNCVPDLVRERRAAKAGKDGRADLFALPEADAEDADTATP